MICVYMSFYETKVYYTNLQNNFKNLRMYFSQKWKNYKSLSFSFRIKFNVFTSGSGCSDFLLQVFRKWFRNWLHEKIEKQYYLFSWQTAWFSNLLSGAIIQIITIDFPYLSSWSIIQIIPIYFTYLTSLCIVHIITI